MRALQSLRRTSYKLTQKTILLKNIGSLPVLKTNLTFPFEGSIPFFLIYVSCRNFCRKTINKETYSFEKYERTMEIYYNKY
jgi:hypothetical protein